MIALAVEVGVRVVLRGVWFAEVWEHSAYVSSISATARMTSAPTAVMPGALHAKFSRTMARSERLGSLVAVASECSTRCLHACSLVCITGG